MNLKFGGLQVGGDTRTPWCGMYLTDVSETAGIEIALFASTTQVRVSRRCVDSFFNAFNQETVITTPSVGQTLEFKTTISADWQTVKVCIDGVEVDSVTMSAPFFSFVQAQLYMQRATPSGVYWSLADLDLKEC